jgi:hypothetical protein
MPQHSNIIVIRTKFNMLYIITVNFSVTICIWFMRIKFIHLFNISHQLLSILSITFMKNYFLYISIYVEISMHTILCGICVCVYRFFICVLMLEIKLSRGDASDPINQFNAVSFLYSSQASVRISTVICRAFYASF